MWDWLSFCKKASFNSYDLLFTKILTWRKKNFRCEVSKFYELVSHVNHVIDFDIIFFWCDFYNVRIKSLILFFSFSDYSDHLQFDIIHDLILFTVWYHLQFDIIDKFDIMCSLILSADLILCVICLNCSDCSDCLSYSSRMLRKKSDNFNLLK